VCRRCPVPQSLADSLAIFPELVKNTATGY
jgi:hypothetical protein